MACPSGYIKGIKGNCVKVGGGYKETSSSVGSKKLKAKTFKETYPDKRVTSAVGSAPKKSSPKKKKTTTNNKVRERAAERNAYNKRRSFDKGFGIKDTKPERVNKKNIPAGSNVVRERAKKLRARNRAKAFNKGFGIEK